VELIVKYTVQQYGHLYVSFVVKDTSQLRLEN